MGANKLENINKEVPIVNNGNIIKDQKTAKPAEKKNINYEPAVNSVNKENQLFKMMRKKYQLTI